MKKLSAFFALFVGLVICGYSFDFKSEILNCNLPVLNALKANLTEVYQTNQTKDYSINWNEQDTFSIYNDMISTWPVVPWEQYSASVDSTNTVMDFYLCADENCNVKIAKYNTASFDSCGGWYVPTLPWIIDNENNLGFLAPDSVDIECFAYSLTFCGDKDLYYTNTGIVVGGKEISVINSGEYYFAIFWNSTGALVDKKKFTVNNSVAVKDYNSDKFNVSYNSGNITVNSQIAQNADIKVFDINGKQVAATQLKGNSTTINMASKAKGIYIINIKGKDFKGKAFSVSKKINVI